MSINVYTTGLIAITIYLYALLNKTGVVYRDASGFNKYTS